MNHELYTGELTVAATTYDLTSLVALPTYKYDIDPCPTCHQPVTEVSASTGFGGWTTVGIQPCGHPVTCNVDYTTDMSSNTVKVRVKLTPGAPTPQPQAYLCDTSWVGASTWTPYQYQPLVATGISYGGSTSILGELLEICPGLASVERSCPDCHTDSQSLGYLIPHMNDSHQWSREKIAEWLDIIAIEDPSVDLTIKPKEKREQPSLSAGQKKELKALGYGPVTLNGGAITSY